MSSECYMQPDELLNSKTENNDAIYVGQLNLN